MTPFHLLIVIVFISLAFDFTNGWHDAASSIATVVSTRVLRPLWAVVWAAFWNFVAPLTFGTAVAATVGKGLVHLEMVNQQVLLAGLLVASAAAMFPTMLRSTLGDRNSLTAYNSAAGANGLKIAAIWWPVAVALSLGYSLYILRLFRGKVPADR